MKLHYSQTMLYFVIVRKRFYYLIKLHYSQTLAGAGNTGIKFYYLIKLHYSQTNGAALIHNDVVLLPYEITLFSNMKRYPNQEINVLLPYEITLFSNEL